MKKNAFLVLPVVTLVPLSALAAEPAQDLTAGGSATLDTRASTASADVGTTAEPARASDERRRESLRAENGLLGSTGTFRMLGADSGLPGTFRVSLLGSFYTGSEFLCRSCETADGTLQTGQDDITQVGTRVQLSATPIEFLEAYGALRFQTTEDNRGEPQAVHIVGDANVGVKGFWPREADRVYSFGGAADLFLLNRPGAVGIDAASFGLHALGTLDFNNRTDVASRIPLRAHLNVSYLFDNSDNLADAIEKDRADTLGSDQRITRVERFGQDINRVDRFGVGVAVEGAFEVARPFIEWSLDVPIHRGGHACHDATLTAGDECLRDASFSADPSRLTLGTRLYPWYTDWLEGSALLVAFDIGTGGTSNFTEEVRPELPWAAHVGLEYAFDTEPRVEVATREVPKVVAVKPQEQYIGGVVVDAENGTPVSGAIVRYGAKPAHGVVSDEEGKFRSFDVEPGTYTFNVTAEGYAEGSCSATIQKPPEQKADLAKTADVSEEKQAEDKPAAFVQCQLEALPKTAAIAGVVRDAETTMPLEGANVKITDPRGRELTLTTDNQGAFRFEQVPSGKSTVSVDRDGYLHSTSEFDLEPRKDLNVQVAVHARPKQPKVIVTKQELKLREQVHFQYDSTEILPDSMALLEEVAQVLRDKPDIAHLEIQGHTDNAGTADYNLALSTRRAEAVRNALIRNGIDASRLTAKGYGQQKPLVPNTSDANRQKNRRVQLIITP